MHTPKLITLAATLASAQLASAAVTVFTPTFDTPARTSNSGALDRDHATRLSVGALGATSMPNSAFRSYLTFDLTTATVATQGVKLELFRDPFGPANTSTMSHNFTLFSLATDWDNAPKQATAPYYPLGTDLATFNITTTSGTVENSTSEEVVTFEGAALTAAYNAAIGGNLFLGIYSPEAEAQTTVVRSFMNIASSENANTSLTPKLTVIPEPSAALMSAIGLLALLRRRKG